MYLVITGDVINSKKNENFDTIFKEKVKLLNERYPNKISLFSISRGDEVQGVVPYDKNIFRDIRILRSTLYPIKLRVAIGVGDVYLEESEIDSSNSWSMNGETFHIAREILTKVSKEKLIVTKVGAKNKTIENILNSFYLMNDSIIEKWSEKNWEIALSYEKTNSYAETAVLFGISRSAVWQKIKSMKFDSILNSEKYLKKELFKNKEF